MSRSVRKNPVCGWYGAPRTSEKWWKRCWHRQMRSHCRIRPHQIDVETFSLCDQRQFHADREWGQSGKVRFNPREHPKLMRK
ncbi:MAG TPA: hypothetical protein VGB45_01055 [Abditibacterium sp.]